MEIIILIGVVAIGFFIYSKFKKFEKIKYQIIGKLIEHGFEDRRAIAIYDTNHYEISKMVSAGFSVIEIVERVAAKYPDVVKAHSDQPDNPSTTFSEDENLEFLMNTVANDQQAEFVRGSVKVIAGVVEINLSLLSGYTDVHKSHFTVGYVSGLTKQYLDFKGLEENSDVGQLIYSLVLMNLFGEDGSYFHLDQLEAHENNPDNEIKAGTLTGKADMLGLLTEQKPAMELCGYFHDMKTQ